MADTRFDLIVIGGGPGGYVTAIRAAQLGMSTALVEREHLGGICLNWGCIPTKALLRTSEIAHLLQHLPAYGFDAVTPRFDIDKVVKRSRAVAKQLSQGVTHLLRKNKVTVFDGTGRLSGRQTVAVSKDGAPVATLTAPHIILATGARARQLPGIEADGKLIWTYKEAMVPTAMPQSLLVIGSGAIGIEFASFYSAMGAKVTVVEAMDRILPVEDAEISAFAQKAFEKQGMTILTGAGVDKLEVGATAVKAAIKDKDGKIVSGDYSHVIVAIGIVPNTENIGLEDLGIKTERGHIVTDPMCRTSVDGIWAIGDVTAPPWLAHKASHEGVIAAEAIAGKHPHAMDVRNIPGCTYCHPQIASVGLTEAKAKEAGYEVKVGMFPFIGNGKAIALGEAEGFTKTVFDARTGELLGAHMVGAEVTEMIQGYTIGKTLETTEAELMHTVFPHPTISESMHESVLAAYGRALHI